MNLIDPPTGAVWGQFNDRKIQSKSVKKMALDFQSDLDNCTDRTTIDIAVKKEWLSKSCKFHRTVDGMKINDVSQLKFTAQGAKEIRDNNLWVLGGHHRREALIVYITKKKEQLANAEKERSKIEGQNGASQEPGSDVPANGATEKELDEKIMKLEADITMGSLWVVRVYDRGESIHGSVNGAN
jgi:hypothetical protein